MSATTRFSPIVELRQYDLHPGTYDTLLDIFDKHFIRAHEADGMAVIGLFRDLDNPDSFVWLRGFEDMESRKQALTAFYSGPVWMANREAANATMISFDNVYLLRPAWPEAAFSLDNAKRSGSAKVDSGLIAVNVIRVRDDVEAFAAWHRENMLPVIEAAGAEVVGVFVTEPAENTYPALPVHTDRKVLAIFSRFADAAAQERTRVTLAGSAKWAEAAKASAAFVEGPPLALRLAPTARSLLR